MIEATTIGGYPCERNIIRVYDTGKVFCAIRIGKSAPESSIFLFCDMHHFITPDFVAFLIGYCDILATPGTDQVWDILASICLFQSVCIVYTGNCYAVYDKQTP
jgi:hypothetical protein